MDELTIALNKAKIGLMSRPHSSFFFNVLFSLKFIWDESIPTAATNGSTLRFNPKFFLSLSPEERIFVLIHEAMHVAYMHMERGKAFIFNKYNVAADYVINLQLVERGFTMPKIGLLDYKYKDMSAEEVYRLLPEDPPNPMPDLEPTEGDPNEFQKEVEDILVRAAIQSKMDQDAEGTIPGDIQIFLNKLLNPKLPWQRILQKYFRTFDKHDYSFKRPNKRFFPDHYLPNLHSEALISLTIAVDASGSVSDDDFNTFISETNGILKFMKPEKITLIQFDTQIKSIDTVKNIRELSKVEFSGRGGTRIEPVLKWAEENKPQVLLIFTDGFFKFYQQFDTVETVWLIHNNKKFNAPFGKTIHYEI